MSCQKLYMIIDHEDSTKLYNMHCLNCGGLCCYADDSSFSFSSPSPDIISMKLAEKYKVIAEFMDNNVFYHTVVLLYKTKQNQSPKYLYHMCRTEFKYKTRAKDAGKLRDGENYKPKKDLNSDSYKWRSIRCWNKLPPDITLIPTLPKFKSKLKSWVMQNIDINP